MNKKDSFFILICLFLLTSCIENEPNKIDIHKATSIWVYTNCKHVKDDDSRLDCLYQKAVLTSNASICNLIHDKFYNYWCYWDLAKTNISLCDALSDKNEITLCLATYSDPSLCDNYVYPPKCYYSLAIESKNISICNVSKNITWVNECINTFDTITHMSSDQI